MHYTNHDEHLKTFQNLTIKITHISVIIGLILVKKHSISKSRSA